MRIFQCAGWAMLGLLFLTGISPRNSKTQKAVLPKQQFAKSAVSSFQSNRYAKWTKSFLAKLPGLNKVIKAVMKKNKIPGASVALVIGGKTVWTAGFGFANLEKKWKMTPQTVGRIGSITKVFSAIALMQLWEKGLLALDEPVARVVPEIASVLYPTRDSPRITYRHLMTHSSGLPRLGRLDYYSNPKKSPTVNDIVSALRGTRLLFSPGTKTSYSNLAMAVVGLAVSRIKKAKFRTVVSNQILRPLGMVQSVWSAASIKSRRLATGYLYKGGQYQKKEHWNMGDATSMGGLYSSAEDMARFIRWQLRAWPASNRAERGPLRRSTIRMSHLPLGGGPAKTLQVGANWFTRLHPIDGLIARHSGSTHLYSASIQIRPQAGVGLIVIANRANPSSSRISRVIWKQITASRPAKVHRVSAPMKMAIKGFLKQLRSPSEKGVKALFTPVMIKILTLPKLVKIFKGIHKDLGAFTVRKVAQQRPDHGFVILRFQKMSLKASLSIERTKPYRIKGMNIRPHKK